MAGAAPAGYEEEVAPPAHLGGYDEEVPPPADSPHTSPGLWDRANTGFISPATLINSGASLMQRPPDMLPNETAQQYFERGKTKLDPDNPTLAGVKAGLSGTVSDLGNLASSLTSPMSIALAGSGPLSKVLPKAGVLANTARAALKGTELASSLGFAGKGIGDVVGAGLENTPEAWQQRLQGAAQTVAGAAGLSDASPSFQRAKNWLNNKVYPVVGQNVVNVSKPSTTFSDLLNRPLGRLLPVAVRDILNDFNARMAPNATAMPFQELHQWTSDVNSYLNSKEGKGLPAKSSDILKQGVSEARQALDHSADVAGVKDEWQAFNREYSKAIKLSKAANLSGTAIGAGVGGAAGFEAANSLGLPGPLKYLSTSAGAGAGGLAGRKVVGGMMDSVLNRNPTVRLPIVAGQVTPPPGAIESVMQAAKDGTISPGKATTILSNMGVSTKVNQPYWKAKTYPDTGSQ